MQRVWRVTRFILREPLLLILGAAIIIGSGVIIYNDIVYNDPCPGDSFETTSGLIRNWPNTDFCTYQYPSSEFRSGGVSRDGIPPIYPAGYRYPDDIRNLGGDKVENTVRYESIAEGDARLSARSPVIALEINGDARAYPLGILTRHEVANTRVGNIPVVVTFCPLCNTGIVFDRRVNGNVYHFGVSGYLRNSDLVMWDHETESWWQQATGEGIVGDMTGQQLTFLTSSMVSWQDFKQMYPEGRVLAPPRNDQYGYDYNPYPHYDSREPFLFTGTVDRRLDSTERVLGYAVERNERTVAIAYPFAVLEEKVVVNDNIAGSPIVVFWQPGAQSALDAYTISESKEVGAATLFSRTLEDGTVLTFRNRGGRIQDRQTESTWNIFGLAIEGELKGTQLQQEIAVPYFWFAWQAFHPRTELYTDS